MTIYEEQVDVKDRYGVDNRQAAILISARLDELYNKSHRGDPENATRYTKFEDCYPNEYAALKPHLDDMISRE